MRTLTTHLALAAAVFAFLPVKSQLTTYYKTPEELAGLIMPPGFAVSNVQYIGHPSAIAFFHGNASDIGLNYGLLLATGAAYHAEGPNNNPQKTSDFQIGPSVIPAIIRDSLAQLTNSALINDPAILHFDFVAADTLLGFQHVFASEEYNEFVSTQYIDFFSIFLQEGNNPALINLSRVPQTTRTLIGASTINNGYSTGCSSGSGAHNPQYFIDNCSGTSVQYDGFTTVLNSVAKLTPNTSYHIWFLIVDAGDDGQYDSGVFIKGMYQGAGIAESTETHPAVSPNPSDGMLRVEGWDEISQVDIFDLSGRLLRSVTIGANQTAEIFLDAPAGLYVLSQKGKTRCGKTKIIRQN